MATSGQPEIIAAIFWRRRRTVILTVLLALLASGAYLKFAKPVFTSNAKLVIDSQRAALADSLVGGPTRADTVQDTKAKLLVATPVLTSTLETLPAEARTSITRQKDPIAWLRQKLKIETSRRDDFITVSFTSPDAKIAADIVNGVVSAFLAYDKSLAQSGPEKMVSVLEKQRQGEETALKRNREELISFGNAHPNLSSGAAGYNNVIVQKLDSLQKQAVDIDLSLGKSRSELQQFKGQVATPEGIKRFVDTQQLKGAEFFDKEYLSIQAEIAKLNYDVAIYGDDTATSRNPNSRRNSGGIAELQAQADTKRRAMVAAWDEYLGQQVESGERRLASLQRDIATQRQLATEMEADQVGLADRRATVERSQSAVDKLAEQIRNTNFLGAGSALNVHVVENARVETESSGPGLTQTLAVGGLVGLVCGCGLAMLRESTDRRVRDPNQVAAALSLPIVGLIPQMTRAAVRAMSKPGGRGAAALLTSDAAEAYRSLYAMLAHGRETAEAKMLLITSAMPGDGKSSCASNLAFAYAEAGRRTLLIDCDLRRPVQHNLFDDAGSGAKVRGITDVIAGSAKLVDVVRATAIPNLGLLPCGTVPTNPHELLNSDRLDAIVKFARKSFDMVIIDSPPIVNVPDARVLAAKADGVVLVVRTNRTTDRQSMFARNELLGVGARVCGVVLNAVPRRTSEFAYYGSYKPQGGTMPISSRPKTATANGSFWPESTAPRRDHAPTAETAETV